MTLRLSGKDVDVEEEKRRERKKITFSSMKREESGLGQLKTAEADGQSEKDIITFFSIFLCGLRAFAPVLRTATTYTEIRILLFLETVRQKKIDILSKSKYPSKASVCTHTHRQKQTETLKASKTFLPLSRDMATIWQRERNEG